MFKFALILYFENIYSFCFCTFYSSHSSSAANHLRSSFVLPNTAWAEPGILPKYISTLSALLPRWGGLPCCISNTCTKHRAHTGCKMPGEWDCIWKGGTLRCSTPLQDTAALYCAILWHAFMLLSSIYWILKNIYFQLIFQLKNVNF